MAAYKFYCDKDLTDAHSAEADTRATYEVLKAQLDRYAELQNDVTALAEFSARGETADYAGRIGYNEKGEEVYQTLPGGVLSGMDMKLVLEENQKTYSGLLQLQVTADYIIR